MGCVFRQLHRARGRNQISVKPASQRRGLFIMKFSPITKPLSKFTIQLVETFADQTPWGPFFVPIGFIYNGASIPRLGQFVLGVSRYGAQVRGPAVVHDYHYRYQTRSRRQSDKIFYWMLRANGVNVFKAALMYRTLRLFGRMAWNKNKSK